MNLNLESLQAYNQCWQPKEPQEVFYCELCGKTITEMEHSKYNGLCYGFAEEDWQEIQSMPLEEIKRELAGEGIDVAKMVAEPPKMFKKIKSKELRSALKEIDIAWEYIIENSPLDFAIAVQYCTIKNLINALKIKELTK